MIENTPVSDSIDSPIEELRVRAELLEQQLHELEKLSEARLVHSEMKTEAIRAGMIDLDAMKLLDLSNVKLNDRGEVEDAVGFMARFKKTKPWIFSTLSSSHTSNAPLAQPPRQKHVSEMTNAEYSIARAAILKRQY
jgi:hypothetical protein